MKPPKKGGWYNEPRNHGLAAKGIKVRPNKTDYKKNMMNKSKPPLGSPISAERYDDMLNVLPPLTMGKEETAAFLRQLDDNPELAEKVERPDVKGVFMQGEGLDKHDVYIRTADGKYYKAGKTKQVWNTEMFRYND